MTIITDTFVPYEFDTRREYYDYITKRCHGIKGSLKFIEMDNEHLKVRCPLVGDYIEIIGDEDELNWLHAELSKHRWYRSI